MLRVTMLAALAAAALSASPAVAQEADFYNNGLWHMRPLSLEVDASPQQARIGAFLFTQDVGSADQAILSDAFSTEAFVTRLVRRAPVALNQGAALHAVTNLRPMDLVYCDAGTGFINDQRLCFVDYNRDGVFDRMVWALRVPTNNYAPMMLIRRAHSEVSVPYTIRSETSERLLTVGVVITRGALGAYRMKFALLQGDEPYVFQHDQWARPHEGGGVADASEVNFRSADLPLTVELAGARVELTAIQDDTVSYRVLSPFPPDTSLSIANFHRMPR